MGVSKTSVYLYISKKKVSYYITIFVVVVVFSTSLQIFVYLFAIISLCYEYSVKINWKLYLFQKKIIIKKSCKNATKYLKKNPFLIYTKKTCSVLILWNIWLKAVFKA